MSWIGQALMSAFTNVWKEHFGHDACFASTWPSFITFLLVPLQAYLDGVTQFVDDHGDEIEVIPAVDFHVAP